MEKWKDMLRSDVVAYFIEKGANKAEADRWSQTKVKPCKRKTYENGMGYRVTSSYYSCSEVYAISENPPGQDGERRHAQEARAFDGAG